MFRSIIAFFACVLLFMTSCKGEVKLSDTETIEQNVRNYFFLSDSVDVNIVISDTLRVEQLDEMLDMVDQNLNLVGRDLDTLSQMIDDKSYQKLDYEKTVETSMLLKKSKYQDSVEMAQMKILEFQVVQSNLSAKQSSFKQTKRILLHLKRSVWADVAGFNIEVNYNTDDVEYDLGLLLDANLGIVD